MTDRYLLTQDEETGYWFILDQQTGKTFECCTKSYAEAKEALAEHILYTVINP